jgi:predicted porin
MFNLGDFSMKKTLVAMAALAAASAFAQSSVTLYGIGDIWFGTLKNGAPGAVSQTLLNSGGLQGSRFGLRGSEDLGGGLKAEFQFENGFSLDTGATSTTNSGAGWTVATFNVGTPPAGVPAANQTAAIFGRQAFIGLNGGFGGVRLGRQYSAYDELRGGTDTLGHTSFSATAGTGAWDRNGANYTFRVNNMIRYETPNMSGFTAAFGYGLGENKTVAAGADSVTSLKAQYANGPIMAGIAFQTEKLGGAPVSLKHTLVAGSYDLGVAKINAGFNTSKFGTLKDSEYSFGATVPMGAFSLAGSYGSSKTKIAGLSASKASAFGVQGIYSLSKRTSAYVGLQNAKTENAAGATITKTNLFALGLRHTF